MFLLCSHRESAPRALERQSGRGLVRRPQTLDSRGSYLPFFDALPGFSHQKKKRRDPSFLEKWKVSSSDLQTLGRCCGAATSHDSADEALRARCCHRPRRQASLDQAAVADFMKEGVPLRMKAAVTRHLLPVLLRMIEIHSSPSDDHDHRVHLCLRCLCLMYEDREVIAAKRAGTAQQALRTLHVARDRLVPGRPWLQWRAKPVLELRWGNCDWLGQHVSAPSDFDAEVSGVARVITFTYTSYSHTHRNGQIWDRSLWGCPISRGRVVMLSKGSPGSSRIQT